MSPQRPVISPQALADLDDIWWYIAQDRSPATADRVIDDIYAAINNLATFPGIGHLRDDLIDEPLRFWNVHNYLIIYRAEAKPIEIARVVSGYRDIARLLE